MVAEDWLLRCSGSLVLSVSDAVEGRWQLIAFLLLWLLLIEQVKILRP